MALCGFEGPRRGWSLTFSGGYGEGETPLPFPNRAVKPLSADGTWPARAWESRSPPVLLQTPPCRLTLTGSDQAKTGGDLLSQALASQVPSALRGLTALFGMGRGVSPSPKPPEKARDHALQVLQNCTAPHRASKKNPSSPRPISTGLLRTLPSFQIRPINLVVYQGSYSL